MLFWYLKKSPDGNFVETFRKGEQMFLMIGLCIGILLGLLLALCCQRNGSIGYLVIVDDTEDGPYLFLEIAKTDISELKTRKTVELRVVNNSNLTHD